MEEQISINFLPKIFAITYMDYCAGVTSIHEESNARKIIPISYHDKD